MNITRIGSMGSPYRILALIPAVVFLCLAACGPDPAVLKRYVIGSPRNHVALMPFTEADKQVDVCNLAEATLQEQLENLGFSVVEEPELDDGNTVFGPSNAPPHVEDVMAYGENCGMPVVLVGRIERAAEGRPFEFATHREVQRTRRDANGNLIAYDQDVVAHPDRPARAPALVIKLKLLDTRTGHELWSSKQDPIPAEWTLEEAVRSTIEQQATDLAATYVAKKL